MPELDAKEIKETIKQVREGKELRTFPRLMRSYKEVRLGQACPISTNNRSL